MCRSDYVSRIEIRFKEIGGPRPRDLKFNKEKLCGVSHKYICLNIQVLRTLYSIQWLHLRIRYYSTVSRVIVHKWHGVYLCWKLRSGLYGVWGYLLFSADSGTAQPLTRLYSRLTAVRYFKYLPPHILCIRGKIVIKNSMLSFSQNCPFWLLSSVNRKKWFKNVSLCVLRVELAQKIL